PPKNASRHCATRRTRHCSGSAQRRAGSTNSPTGSRCGETDAAVRVTFVRLPPLRPNRDTLTMNRPEAPGIPDVQSCPDARELAIDRVGIRGLRYPMQFADGANPPQATVGSFNVYVALPAQQKGTHMSRLVAVIDEMRESLSLDGMSALLDTMLQRLDAEDGRIEIEFPWFMRKAAPVSGVPSMMDYQVKLAADHTDGKRTISATVVVPVMSLCPSSKAISDYGAHNQRSH